MMVSVDCERYMGSKPHASSCCLAGGQHTLKGSYMLVTGRNPIILLGCDTVLGGNGGFGGKNTRIRVGGRASAYKHK